MTLFGILSWEQVGGQPVALARASLRNAGSLARRRFLLVIDGDLVAFDARLLVVVDHAGHVLVAELSVRREQVELVETAVVKGQEDLLLMLAAQLESLLSHGGLARPEAEAFLASLSGKVSFGGQIHVALVVTLCVGRLLVGDHWAY